LAIFVSPLQQNKRLGVFGPQSFKRVGCFLDKGSSDSKRLKKDSFFFFGRKSAKSKGDLRRGVGSLGLRLK